MSINKFRGKGYKILKFLGDIQALTSKKPNAVPKRIGRRIVGKVTGKAIRKLFK